MMIEATCTRATNILTAALSRRQLLEIFRDCPPRSPLPVSGSRRWHASLGKPLAARYCELIRRRALREAEQELPALTDALYSDYARTGHRSAFEAVYLERRRRLGRAAVALLAALSVPAPAPVPSSAARNVRSGQGGAQGRVHGSRQTAKLLESFLRKLESVLDEDSWAFPAHVDNPSGKDPDCIDLFTAQTANLLAECLAVFGERVPQPLQKRLRTRLRKRIFENYLSKSYDWQGQTDNWNAVCHQGVLGAVLALESDAELLADMLLHAAASLPLFLCGFGADGGCSEGPEYWDYGFGRFCALEEQLRARTGGRLTLFGDERLLGAIAGYGPAMSLRDGSLVNFSDCTAGARLSPWLLCYLGQRLGRADCELLAGRLYRDLPLSPAALDAPHADLFYWLRLFLHEPPQESPHALQQEYRHALPQEQPETSQAECGADAGAAAAASAAGDSEAALPDSYYPSLGVWKVSGRDAAGNLWELAAKGGHNNEHHNHNDVGSFILSVGGVRVIAELGMPQYAKGYFSSDRYAEITARSLGHSLPLINGCEQAAGAEYFGTVLHSDTGGGEVAFEVELSQAYPAAAHCRGFIRQLRLDKTAGIFRCTDIFSLSEPGRVESGFIFTAPSLAITSPCVLTLSGTGAVSGTGAGVGCGTLQIKCDPHSRWDRIETHCYRSAGGARAVCYRAVLLPLAREPQTKFKQSLAIRLACGH